MRPKLLLPLFLLLAATAASLAAPVRDKHVTAELIPEVSAVTPGQSFWVALKLVHDPHWHTYWINDGDSGLPTVIDWTLPEGFTAGPIVWPTPKRIEMPPLVSFGFEDEAWLLVEITPPAALDSDAVTLSAKVRWLMCEEVCIPGRAAFSFTLPVSGTPALDPAVRDGFARARDALPAVETGWTFELATGETALRLTATPPPGAAPLTTWTVFPVDKEVITSSAAQPWERVGDTYVMTLERAVTVNPLPDRFRAVLVSEPGMAADPGRAALAVDLPFTSASTAPPAHGPSAAPPPRGLLVISLFAFLGGLILNLMPCVFPVISLKILGFVKQAGEDPRAVWHHGLVFAAGVLVSFWLLAGLLLALRAGGESIGWGFQLQSPPVLIGLSLLFVTLALNLFGVFEFGMSLTSVGGEAERKGGWSGSFFSGCLATVIATPCTAPFMGAALSYALTQPPAVGMTVFTFLALGMASPYLVLSRYPALLKKLPRPGPWMETMKQIMGFLLLATVAWLYWVLAALVTAHTLTVVVASFVLAGFGAWVLGKWDTLSRANPVRWRARAIGVACLGGALALGLGNIDRAEAGTAAAGGAWEPWSPERIAELEAEGRPYFIDFTAKWCLTCQVNKLTVLRTGDIAEQFQARNVATLTADWTDEDPRITAALAALGRQSVPVYVFSDGTGAPPRILPEILTKSIIRDALAALN
jgi:thiol:disulfide interchange protein DsbD